MLLASTLIKCPCPELSTAVSELLNASAYDRIPDSPACARASRSLLICEMAA